MIVKKGVKKVREDEKVRVKGEKGVRDIEKEEMNEEG